MCQATRSSPPANQCVDPHNQGSGPIRANTSIIMDIFPRSQKTGYFGDITRTVVRGRASERLKHAYGCVEEGQRIGFRRIRDGANAYDIHHEILNYFAKEGFPDRIERVAVCRASFTAPGTGSGWISMKLPGSAHAAKTTSERACRDRRTWALLPRHGRCSSRRRCTCYRNGCKNLVRIPKILEV